MAVETYLIDEVQDLVTEPEELDKWKEMISKMGLSGQEELIGKEKKSPIPFPLMNVQMMNVYHTLCPSMDKVNEYNKTTIPLRVLSMISLAKEEGYFDQIEIWSDNKAPDPIVVGTKKDAKETWRTLTYIVARWGDELRSFPELLQIAKKRYLEQMRAEGTRKYAELKAKLDNLDNLVEDHFENGTGLYL
jgi:hypothetical protein